MKNLYSKRNKCSICGKLISNKAKKCPSCSQLGNYKGYKDGHCIKPHYCLDCGIKVSCNAKRCKSCANSGKNHPQYTGKKAKYRQKYYCKLDGCFNLIKYDTWRRGQGMCKPCARQLHSERIKGHNHPNYRDGSSLENYPSKFNEKLKRSIRKRDNYICQNCKMTEEEHLIVYGNVLNIHHMDYDKQNCSKDNLITVCTSCNLRANYNREYWIKIYQEKIAKILLKGV